MAIGTEEYITQVITENLSTVAPLPLLVEPNRGEGAIELSSSVFVSITCSSGPMATPTATTLFLDVKPFRNIPPNVYTMPLNIASVHIHSKSCRGEYLYYNRGKSKYNPSLYIILKTIDFCNLLRSREGYIY